MADKFLQLEDELARRYGDCEDHAATPSSILLSVLNAVAAVNRPVAELDTPAPTLEQAMALADEVSPTPARAHAALKVLRDALMEQSAGRAPRAQKPLHGAANNAGVATGSRNAPASESVTPGSSPPTDIVAGIDPRTRVCTLVGSADRETLRQAMEQRLIVVPVSVETARTVWGDEIHDVYAIAEGSSGD